MGNKNLPTSPYPCTTWTPSNTAMPRATPCTSQNCSSDGSLHTPSHSYAAQWGAPYLPPKNYPFPWTDPQTLLLPHPWTRPTCHAKQHPDPFRHFSTVHWTDRPTNRWSVGMVWHYWPLMLYRQQRGLKTKCGYFTESQSVVFVFSLLSS